MFSVHCETLTKVHSLLFHCHPGCYSFVHFLVLAVAGIRRHINEGRESLRSTVDSYGRHAAVRDVCGRKRETEWKTEGEEQCVRPITKLLSLVILKLLVWLLIQSRIPWFFVYTYKTNTIW